MTYDDIESIVVSKLIDDLPELKIELYPDSPDKYQFKHPIGVVLIGFDGSDYTQPQMEQQGRIITLSANMIFRNLRSHTQGYKLLEKVRQSITSGFIQGTQRFYCSSEKYLRQVEDKWYFESRFIMPDIIRRGY